ncbi:MAG: sugar phosphate isomerase/epimerase [Opitutaceae bacterium]|nr:sugar phosphate isomerase/epimerase [Opitutaceae bacterium]
MITPVRDTIGIEIIEKMPGLGFDYIELSLRDLAAAPAALFDAMARRIAAAGISCEACNNFFPPSLRFTGAEANPTAALSYAERSLERADRLGAKSIVFGSAGSRNVPPGFSHDTAWKQLVELLQKLGSLAARHGITIVIEHLNRQESNIVNSAAEGLRLQQAVDHPNVQLLIDSYHLLREAENPEIVRQAGAAIRHVHCASGMERRFPSGTDAQLAAVIGHLRQIGYAGRCSIEAYTSDFPHDARQSLLVLKRIWEGKDE